MSCTPAVWPYNLALLTTWSAADVAAAVAGGIGCNLVEPCVNQQCERQRYSPLPPREFLLPPPV